MSEDTQVIGGADVGDLGAIRQGGHRSVLEVRRTEEGLRVVGDPPPLHLLASSFVERGVTAGDVEVLVRFGGVTYALRGYELDDRGEPNRSSWIVELVGREEV